MEEEIVGPEISFSGSDRRAAQTLGPSSSALSRGIAVRRTAPYGRVGQLPHLPAI